MSVDGDRSAVSGISYDNIGSGYSATRRNDPVIAAHILRGLGDCATVVNVGAGTGSYEPQDRQVFAVEPSRTMIRQRAIDCAPVVQAAAEMLPFGNDAVEATMAILTLHHWMNPAAGLKEMRRVASNRVVILTWDQQIWESFWLVTEYFPCVRELDRARAVAIEDILTSLGGGEVVRVMIPNACQDGFFGAFWQRPGAYLDPGIRSGISTYSMMSSIDLHTGLERLQADIESGDWMRRHGELLELTELDLGYRLIIA